MPPEEYRAILDRLGLSQVGAARFLGINPRTSRDWAEGRKEMHPAAARYLRFLAGANLRPKDTERPVRRWLAEFGARENG